ncbi:hypothetical protein [Segetibacter koreensis]|uniref:hypothetical protein n=1 Tax=Segetibacter koreensis TaxID=398037 RepID=UPI0003622A5A|nr:hypothetical protein [Segetibacter koreensis]
MRYQFSDFLEGNYDQLKPFLEAGEELSKKEILEKCSGEIDYDLLQQIKELEFEKIGKTDKDQLYLV